MSYSPMTPVASVGMAGAGGHTPQARAPSHTGLASRCSVTSLCLHVAPHPPGTSTGLGFSWHGGLRVPVLPTQRLTCLGASILRGVQRSRRTSMSLTLHFCWGSKFQGIGIRPYLSMEEEQRIFSHLLSVKQIMQNLMTALQNIRMIYMRCLIFMKKS